MLKERYVKKMIPEAGLCISVAGKSLNIRDQIIIHGEGSVQVFAEFDVLIFKPRSE